MNDHYRSYFDPEINTVITFDQRGCGRSSPSAAEDIASLNSNTTHELIGDIEALRTLAGLDRWIVVGLSWGATLALAYAEAHPNRVIGLALGAVTTTSRSEVEWITQDLRHLFPDEWSELAAAANPEPGERLIDALYRSVISSEPQDRERAAIAWSRWEDTHVSLDPNFSPDPRWQNDRKRLEIATLVLHYWSNHAFLGDTGILDNVGRLVDIPGSMVHGRRDLSSSMSIPFDLQRAWPGSRLTQVKDEGHFGPGIFTAIRENIRALSTFL